MGARYPERDEQIIKMVVKGYSASKVAKKLNNIFITRNVVIGVVHRARAAGDLRVLDKMVVKDAQARIGHNKAARAKPFRFAEEAKRPAEEPKPIGLVGDFPNDSTTCRFIHGEVRGRKYQLCGHPGYPWCDDHKPKPTSQKVSDNNEAFAKSWGR